MPTARCRQQILRLHPPDYCDDIAPGHCAKIQTRIRQYCFDSRPDSPVPQITPDGRDCWCCCECFAFHTPIEVAPGQYKFIQEITMDELVLTTGPKLDSWVPRRVTELSGLEVGVEVAFMHVLAFRCGDGPEGVRHLVATADHLFLLPDGKLRPMADLRPGDQLRGADGGIAEVLYTVTGKYSGGVRHVALGEYEPGDPLDGHLVNSNGLISADLGVQLAYFGGCLPAGALAADRA